MHTHAQPYLQMKREVRDQDLTEHALFASLLSSHIPGTTEHRASAINSRLAEGADRSALGQHRVGATDVLWEERVRMLPRFPEQKSSQLRKRFRLVRRA